MAKQLSLPLRRRGGKRPGAGRKPNGTRSGTAHRPRATFRSRKPVLVTKRLLRCIPSLRQPGMFRKFHSRVLDTPREVRNAIQYVLLNARKRGLIKPAERRLDPYSSAASFDGWARAVSAKSIERPQPQAARTWLLRVGWRKHGKIDPAYVPG